MILSPPTAPAAPANPNQPTLPGLEPDVIARYAPYPGSDVQSPVKLRADRPVDAPTFAAFDDAVRAAQEIMVVDRKAARWGLFKRLPGKVDSIALLQSKDGIRLARTTLAIDSYKEPVPGQMFPGQHWWRGAPNLTVRETPDTLALVGAETLIDLRSGEPTQPSPLPAR